jgi:cellobiose-specific phosphotransferase system component IIA
MDLNISTFSDLLRILDQRPEWRQRLRESLYPYPEGDVSKALRELAEAEQRLAEAQRRTQEALEGLTTRDKAREREFEQFDERHRKSMEELDRIKEIVLDSIARDQAREKALR